MEFFQNKYRINSTRLADWDYGSNGFYFVTICTKSKEPFFGEIENTSLIGHETQYFASFLLDVYFQMNMRRKDASFYASFAIKKSIEMDLFQNKYRINSARLANWDYGVNGFYFVTICTKGKEPCFGEIQNTGLTEDETQNLASLHDMLIFDKMFLCPKIRSSP